MLEDFFRRILIFNAGNNQDFKGAWDRWLYISLADKRIRGLGQDPKLKENQITYAACTYWIDFFVKVWIGTPKNHIPKSPFTSGGVAGSLRYKNTLRKKKTNKIAGWKILPPWTLAPSKMAPIFQWYVGWSWGGVTTVCYYPLPPKSPFTWGAF